MSVAGSMISLSAISVSLPSQNVFPQSWTELRFHRFLLGSHLSHKGIFTTGWMPNCSQGIQERDILFGHFANVSPSISYREGRLAINSVGLFVCVKIFMSPSFLKVIFAED